MLITTDGVITRSYPAGDHDRLVHLVTFEHGRLAVMVKGGQSRGCRHAAITQLFTFGNYELYHKGDLYWLRGGSVITPFYELSREVAYMALGAYLCDLTSDMTEEGEIQECGALMRMLLNSLYAIGQGKHSLSIIKGVFELRAASVAGYMPRLTGCCKCGEGYPDACYFDIMNGRLICADCQRGLNNGRSLRDVIEEQKHAELGERRIICPMTTSTLAAARYALTAPEKKIFSFVLKDKDEEMLFSRVAETFLLNQLERGFDTLDFYHAVTE